VAGPPPEEKSSGSGFFLADWCVTLCDVALRDLPSISGQKEGEAM